MSPRYDAQPKVLDAPAVAAIMAEFRAIAGAEITSEDDARLLVKRVQQIGAKAQQLGNSHEELRRLWRGCS